MTIVKEGTRLTLAVTTSGNGQYVVDSFPTGRISLTVEHVGFEKLVRTGVVLTPADTVTVNLQLSVGNVQQTVEVQAEASLVQSQSATVSTLISNTQMIETPLNGRMFTQLIQLSPLTSLTGYGIRINMTVSINGATAQNNSYLIDGI